MLAASAGKLCVVLDTNVLLSAWLKPGSVPGDIYQAARHNIFQSITSLPILAELEKILIEKFELLPQLSYEQARRFADMSTVIKLKSQVAVIPNNHGDNLILATAIDGQADYLVTGDTKHLLPLKKIKTCPIITPRQFLNTLQRQR